MLTNYIYHSIINLSNQIEKGENKMLDFKIIRNALEDNFKKMCEKNENLFEVELNKDVLWETYLNTIPAKDKISLSNMKEVKL